MTISTQTSSTLGSNPLNSMQIDHVCLNVPNYLTFPVKSVEQAANLVKSQKPTQFRERLGSPQPPITASPTLIVPRRRAVVVRQPPVSSRVRLPNSRHQRYIQLADSVLKHLRDHIVVVQLPEALAILRKMNPYAFEELLLTCCQEQG